MKKTMVAVAIVFVALAATACSSNSAVGTGKAATTTSSSAVTSASKGSATTTTTTAKAPKGVYTLGQTVTTPPTIDGIVSATVYGFYPNITSSQPDVDQPPTGKTYGAIDAQECAGSSGSNTGADETDFTVLLSNGSTAGDPDSLVGNPTVGPLASESELGSAGEALSAGQCDRGWIVFDIPDGTTPTYVQFTGTTAGLNGNTVAKWTIPAASAT